MCIKKRGGGFGREEDAVWGILGNGAMFVMELEVFEAELHRALMVSMTLNRMSEEGCSKSVPYF